MTDSLLLPISLTRLTDSSGNPMDWAAYVYDAGTTNEADVFTDATLNTAADNPIESDSAGFLGARYIGTGSYKLVIKDRLGSVNENDWTTLFTIDDLPGALDTSAFDADTAIPDTPVISKAVNYNVLSTDRGKVIAGNASGGDISITLLSAVTAGDGWRLTVKNVGASGTVTVDTSGGETIDGVSAFDLDDQYESITVTSNGANWIITDAARLFDDIVTPLPRGYLAGLQTSNGTDADHDINIAVGVARAATDGFNFTIAAIHTKRIDASWASGSGNGGLASGVSLSNNTTYHYFLVDDGAGNTEAGFDTSLTAANLLSDTGGTFYRRIASVRTDGSANILGFTQKGDVFLLDDPPLDLDLTDQGTSSTGRTLTVPSGVKVLAILNVSCGHNSGKSYVYIRDPDQNDEAPSATVAPLATCSSEADGSNIAYGNIRVGTNTASQVATRASGTSTILRIATMGWVDTRGRDA